MGVTCELISVIGTQQPLSDLNEIILEAEFPEE